MKSVWLSQLGYEKRKAGLTYDKDQNNVPKLQERKVSISLRKRKDFE